MQDDLDGKVDTSILTDASTSATRVQELEQLVHFFSGMTCELKNSFPFIMDLTERFLAQQQDDSQKESVNDIRYAIQSLQVHVDDVHDLSLMRSGKFELCTDTFSFRQLIENVRSTTFFLAEEKKLQFIFKIDGSLPEFLEGDPARIRQVLMSILGCAVKHTRVGHVSLWVYRDGDTIHFDVSDSGTGMDVESLRDLFDADRQTDNSELALLLGKNLVELMGGAMTVESGSGAKSRFHFHLPLKQPSENRRRTNTTRRVSTRESGRILVVDGDQINQFLTKHLLDQYGVQSDMAFSGEEALEKINLEKYALVLIDYLMPGMDGSEVTRLIRSLPEGKGEIPLIAYTESSPNIAEKSFLDADMDDIIIKPVQAEQLREVLARWLPVQEKRQNHVLDKIIPQPDLTSPAPTVDVKSNIDAKKEIFSAFSSGLEWNAFDEVMGFESFNRRFVENDTSQPGLDPERGRADASDVARLLIFFAEDHPRMFALIKFSMLELGETLGSVDDKLAKIRAIHANTRDFAGHTEFATWIAESGSSRERLLHNSGEYLNLLLSAIRVFQSQAKGKQNAKVEEAIKTIHSTIQQATMNLKEISVELEKIHKVLQTLTEPTDTTVAKENLSTLKKHMWEVSVLFRQFSQKKGLLLSELDRKRDFPNRSSNTV